MRNMFMLSWATKIDKIRKNHPNEQGLQEEKITSKGDSIFKDVYFTWIGDLDTIIAIMKEISLKKEQGKESLWIHF